MPKEFKTLPEVLTYFRDEEACIMKALSSWQQGTVTVL